MYLRSNGALDVPLRCEGHELYYNRERIKNLTSSELRAELLALGKCLAPDGYELT